MKISRKVILDRPIKEVWEIFDNPDNLGKWMPTLKSYEHISGEPGKPGAKARMIFKERGREVEMTEVIVARENYRVVGMYEVNGTINKVTNEFKANGNKTIWLITSEFKFGGLMRLLSPLMKSSIKKRTQKDIEGFKNLVESNKA